ncbi:hypothetical protein ABIB66_006157 [Bradyrhizobium sp. F1.13.3]
MGGQPVLPSTNVSASPEPSADHQTKPSEAPGKSPSTEGAKPSGLSVKPSDYISLTALLISLSTAVYNAWGWVQGPRVSFYPPELVSFHCTAVEGPDEKPKCKADSNVFVAGSSMTYLNSGRPEYGAVLLEERAALAFSPQQPVTLHWQEFANLTSLSASSSQAAAIQLPGASSIAHETRFFPRDEPCKSPCNPAKNFMRWTDFLDHVVTKKQDVTVTFSAKWRGGGEPESQSRACSVFVRDDDRKKWATELGELTRLSSLTCRYQ